MKKLLIFALALVFLITGFAFASPDFKTRPMGVSSDSPDYVPGEIIVKFKPGYEPASRAQLTQSLGCSVTYTSDAGGYQKIAIPADKTVEELVALYQADPNVLYAEPDYICRALMVPNDPYYVYQWHMPMINTEAAWDQNTGAGVIVAILDAGVAYEDYDIYAQAPDLAQTSFVAGYDFINNDSHPNDDNGHGTHVAGTVAQSTNNGLGVTGIAFDCSIMPVKVLDAGGSGPTTVIAEGIYFAADNGAKVINMSLGSRFPSTTMEDACNYAYNHGVTIVCAAGNSGRNILEYPAAYPSCISVSSVGFDSTLAYYSTYNTEVDITAPGGDVRVDLDGDGYVDGVLQQTHDGANFTEFGYYFYQGTSMASPHVAGVAALVISASGGTLSPAEVQTILENSAVDIGPAGWDIEYGHGLLDANAALQLVAPNTDPPVADFSGSPTSGYAPLTVNFTDLSTNSPTGWSWTFGDGGTSGAQNPTYVYNNPGTYTVTLTATNAYGSDSETKVGYITVSSTPQDPPVADFSGSPTSGYASLTVNFTDLSANSPTSWSWTFGDGGTSTEQNPTYTYDVAGTYTVSLTATNAYGSDTETKTGYITVSDEPQPGGTMHVHDIVVTVYQTGRNYAGHGTITIYDDANQPLANATVYVTATGPTGGSGSAITGTDGTVSFTTPKTKTGAGDWCFEVTNVTHASYTYAPDDNVVTMSCVSGDVYSDGGVVFELTPNTFGLSQNYPNPFNPTTEISFSLASPSFVTLQVFNIRGQQVTTLANGSFDAGVHTVTWNATEEPSGIYFYRLSAGDNIETKKMLLLK